MDVLLVCLHDMCVVLLSPEGCGRFPGTGAWLWATYVSAENQSHGPLEEQLEEQLEQLGSSNRRASLQPLDLKKKKTKKTELGLWFPRLESPNRGAASG